MPKTKKPPLPVGTPVTINIAQGMSVAQGVVAAAEYDDGWMYRIDVSSGDDCQVHRNPNDELWVCECEVTPIGSVPAAEKPTRVPYTVEVVGDLLVVLDEDGNGCDAYGLYSLRKAKRQLHRWQDEYTFDYAEALRAVSEFFANL
jgi:hypothetical protein